MSIKFVDFPFFYSKNVYEEVINKQVRFLKKNKDIKSIFQIGGINTPGVSDIDLVVVFRDNTNYPFNPRKNFDIIENYLFTHNPFGISESDFKRSQDYSFFHNYKLLHGVELNVKNNLDGAMQKELKVQIALEYFLRMYINLVMQKEYQVIKIRSLFLHLKALLYDFEFMDIEDSIILNLIKDGISLRENWFKDENTQLVEKWFYDFYEDYEKFIEHLFDSYILHSNQKSFYTSKTVKVIKNNKLYYKRSGIKIPYLPTKLG